MRIGTLKWIYNRKALFCLCVVVTGLGIALILLASSGGVLHLLAPNQSNETGEGILLRLIGGMFLVLVGFAGVVLGSVEPDENAVDWMESERPGKDSMGICCCACQALNDVQAVCCCDCGVGL